LDLHLDLEFEHFIGETGKLKKIKSEKKPYNNTHYTQIYINSTQISSRKWIAL